MLDRRTGKRIGKISLSQLSKRELEDRNMNALRGGRGECECGCNCQCYGDPGCKEDTEDDSSAYMYNATVAYTGDWSVDDVPAYNRDLRVKNGFGGY